MNVTIIYTHPFNKSFNYSILEKVKNTLNNKHTINIIDLYKDNFNPVLKY